MWQAFVQYLHQNPDIGLIVPEMQLALFGLAILLMDFLLDARSKS
jgi:hypothetical protein